MRKIAVVTTMSVAGWNQYGRNMVKTFDENWPAEVELYVYPDELVPDAVASQRVHYLYPRIDARSAFISRMKNVPYANGRKDGPDAPYNYRFDAVKFCNKPYVVDHFVNHVNLARETPFDGVVWLDADTITHTKIPMSMIYNELCPITSDICYLGRRDKYSECGMIYFNLNSVSAPKCISDWAGTFTYGECFSFPEWHDCVMFDLVLERVMKEQPLSRFTSWTDFDRKSGGGHPFNASFAGAYMVHNKGTRKVTGPKKKDNPAGHTAKYWKKHGI